MRYILILILLTGLCIQYRHLNHKEDDCLIAELKEVIELKNRQMAIMSEKRIEFAILDSVQREISKTVNDELSPKELLNILHLQDELIAQYEGVEFRHSDPLGQLFGVVEDNKLRFYKEFYQIDSSRVKVHYNDMVYCVNQIEISRNVFNNSKIDLEFIERIFKKSQFLSCNLNELICE